MRRRTRVPDTVEADILGSCKRRCCICFALHGDLSKKKGQIAHLDHDPSNNGADNLAFLCLDHHDEYDSRTSQSKGLTFAEVKRARADLLGHFSQPDRGLPEGEKLQSIEADVERLKKAREPRRLDVSQFAAALKDTPQCEVEVLYQPHDSEAHSLAMSVFMGLLDSWQPAVTGRAFPRPIPPDAARPDLLELPPQILRALLPMARLTVSPYGISILSGQEPDEANVPRDALAAAFKAAGFGVWRSAHSGLPDGLLLVVVGPKG